MPRTATTRLPPPMPRTASTDASTYSMSAPAATTRSIFSAVQLFKK
jgi:hypothetical protein